MPHNDISTLARALRRAPRTRPRLRFEAAPAPEPAVPGLCRGPEPGSPVGDIVRFHQLIELAEIHLDSTPRLACTPVHRPRLTVTADILYAQRWSWQARELRDLAATIGLAPAEELTIEVSTKRRRSVTEERRQQSELTNTSESSESTKSSTEVTQASTKTRNWSVSTNAEVGLAGQLFASGGVEGSFQNSVESTATDSVNRINETTSRSSETLRSMEEIRVERTVEETVERGQRRVLRNPYRSRSLVINVFSLANRYQVSTTAERWAPALAVTFDDLQMDRDFVLANADFLQQVLLDRTLAVELPDAIASASASNATNINAINALVRRAFELLLDVDTGVFKTDGGEHGRFSVSGSLDVDLAETFGNTGLYDAAHNGFGRGYAAIAAVHWLRERDADDGELTAEERAQRELDYCLSLADTVKPEWSALSGTYLSNLLDQSDNTEVIRRVGGFLSFVEGVLRPLTGQRRTTTVLLDVGSDEEQLPYPIAEPGVDEDARAGDDIVAKVVEHLACYRTYYERRYLLHLFTATDGVSFVEYFDAFVAGLEADLAQDLLQAVDRSSAYLDGNTWVVHFDATLGETPYALLHAFAEELGIEGTFPDDPSQSGHIVAPGTTGDPLVGNTSVVVPAAGTYLEAVAGTCTLDGIDDDPHGSFSATIGIDGSD